MISKNKISIAVVLLAFCVGCPASDEDANKSRTLPEVVKSAKDEAENFKFCLDDDTGNETLSQSADRLKVIVGDLTELASNSDLPVDSKDKLNSEVEKLETAFESIASAVGSNATDSAKSKAIRSFLKQLSSVSKLLK